MGWFFSSDSNQKKLDWEDLNDHSQLVQLFEEEIPVLIFKHSTRCSISSMALSRFESEWEAKTNCKLIFLDLLAHRDLSNEIETITGIQHQSPQVIVVLKGKHIYNASHNSISVQKIEQLIVNS